MLASVDKFIKAFEKYDVNYCHFKGNNHIEDGMNGASDLDILVLSQDKENCSEALKEAGFIKFNSQLGANFDCIEDYLTVDEETGTMLHIHLYYEIITGKSYVQEYRLPWEEYFIQTAIKDAQHGDILISSREAEYVLVFAIMALTGEKRANRKNKDKIEFFLKNTDKDKLKEVCSVLLKDEEDIVYNGLVSGKYNYEKMAPVFKKAVSLRTSGASLKQDIVKKRIRAKAFLNRNFKSCHVLKKTLDKGFSICFMGADGAGKSTISEDIMKWLGWKIDNKSFYLGCGEQYKNIYKTIIVKISGKRVAKKALSVSSTPESGENGASKTVKPKSKKAMLLSFGMAIISCLNEVTIAKYKLKTLKKAEKYLNEGGIVIFDRFPQVQFEGIYDGPKLKTLAEKYKDSKIINAFQKKERKILNYVTEKYSPNLVIKLMLPPEESIRRKPDHKYEEVAVKAEITQKLKFERAKVVEIDATKCYEDELKEVKNIIWNAIRENL